MEVLYMAGRMSSKQKVEVEAVMIRAAEKHITMKFPLVVKEMDEFDPCIGDLKMLMVLDKIYNYPTEGCE